MSRTARFPCDILPPAPVSFVWTHGGTRLNLTFDFPLVDVGLSTANWRVITASEPAGLEPIAADFASPTVPRIAFESDLSAEAEAVTYAAAPAELIGEPPHDLPVPAFEFPLV